MHDPANDTWALSYVAYRSSPGNASGWLENVRAATPFASFEPSKKRGCTQYDGTIFTRYATEKGDAGLDSDFGDGPTAFAEDRVLLAPDDFKVNGPWPHRCQGEIPHDPAADVFGRPRPMIIIHLSHHCCCYHCRHLGAFLSRFQRCSSCDQACKGRTRSTRFS